MIKAGLSFSGSRMPGIWIACLFTCAASVYEAGAQCPLVETACSGTSVSGSGNVTIPSGTTYYIAAGNTLSGDVTFTNSTSILCIEGTWTGKPAGSSPASGTINVNGGGSISNATAWSFNGGGLTINVFSYGNVTINSISVSGGTFSITNCGDMTFTAATGISCNGGTFTIDNYSAINVNGTMNVSWSGFTFTNRSGSQLYIGNNMTFSAGSFINSGNLCVTATSDFNGGSFTNNDCFRTTTWSVSANNSFTNNNYMKVAGNFSNSGTGNTNNGTLEITGNFSNSGSLTCGSGSLLTSANWTSNGTIIGPGSGCAQMRTTGNSNHSGTISAANSSRLYFYDSGLPAGGFDTNNGTINSLNVNNNTCTPTNYPACTMAGAACATVLPVELVRFSADCRDGNIVLTWITASETNNDYFTVERTRDGVQYETVGMVDSKAPGGNSAQILSYSYTDHSFPREERGGSPLMYYRIRQTDFNGSYSFSSLAAAGCSPHCISNVSILFENNLITLDVLAICTADAEFSVYNTLGQLVTVERSLVEPGHNFIRLTGQNAADGVYVVRIDTRNQALQKKFGKF